METADEGGEESMKVVDIMLWSCCIDINPLAMTLSLGPGVDESLVLGDDVDDGELIFSLFFIVEFQKFLISLSVRPGKRAAICDHL